MIEGVVIVSAMVAYGVYRMVRSQVQARRYLEGASVERPLDTDHLEPALVQILQDTHLLRINLEGTVRVAAELLRTDLMRMQDEVEAASAVLMDASRDVADWVRSVDSLDEHQRQQLTDLGVSPEPIRAAMIAENWSFELKNLKVKGRETLDRRITAIISELARFEAAMQARPRLYR